MDVRSRFNPTRHIDPNEPGLLAAYTPYCDNEIAVHGYPINRAATGAAYDLVTRAGTPLVGQGGGILGVPGSYWTRAALFPQLSGYEFDLETHTANNNNLFANGWGGGFFMWNVAGSTRFSFNNVAGAVVIGNVVGRGPCRIAATYDGASQYAILNGRVVDTNAVVPAVPAGVTRVGESDTTRMLKVWSVMPTVDQLRASYIRDFASKVIWQWQPRDCGEGPAGGILTGSYSGVGGYTCPLGAATMGFVQRGDRLTLTDTQAVNLHRIDFEFGPRPLFGTWIIEYQIRDPATDSPVIGFTPRRGVDPMAAGSTSYWAWMRTAAGPWWRVSMGYENNTAAPIDSADAPWPGPNAGDRCIAVVSRDVDGAVQTWNYVPNPQRGWWWTAATGNHVTTLAEGCLTVAPRGSYIERITWLQGAASPHEIGIQVP